MESQLSGTHAFTSFSYSYLPKAMVLAESLKRFNPSWTLWAIISDRPPAEVQNFDLYQYFDYVVHIEEWDVPPAWIFKHDVVELCTAVKGMALRKLLEAGADKVFYLDPDIAVFSSLSELETQLDEFDIVLTPHQLGPDYTPGAIRDNEICSLQHGVYNLGFLAVAARKEGKEFAKWWEARLKEYCYADIPNGLFTDQKWCDLIPCFFNSVRIHRDPGCNVASWNLSNRKLSQTLDGQVLVNGSPLKFYHFTKLGELGFSMTTRYAGNNVEVYSLWYWYQRRVQDTLASIVSSDSRKLERFWHFSQFEDGKVIPRGARLLYRHRLDLQTAFPNPFVKEFAHWCMQAPELRI
jgi:hypothetical protein